MTRRVFLRSMAATSSALAAAGLASPSRAQGPAELQPARCVLEGVPRIGFQTGQSISFASSLAACLRFLEEDAAYDYPYLLGTSGAAFALLWEKRRWWYVPDLTDRALSTGEHEPIRRAFESVGYDFEVIARTDDANRESYVRRRIIESIHDQARPVLATGVVGPPACGIVTGYDEGGDVLIGWSYFQDLPGHPEAEDLEPSGYYRKRDWYPDTYQVIILGESLGPREPAAVYRSALAWALTLLRGPELYGCHCGLAAYEAWADDLLRDEDFPADDLETLLERLDCHFAALTIGVEGAHYAESFLNAAADCIPDLVLPLRRAARLCDEASALIAKVADLQGGFDPHSEAVARKLAEPATRRQIAALIREAAAKQAATADMLEQLSEQGQLGP